ncbi:MAG: type II toxin-antitoxin system VapC family toxin [Geminicoccaceae bacterium]|nr:type II toxin-antitoxin system VapC family toxin [Geminicoccaceae bacterium]MCB9968714.1 type II toxin-antitoxin system VapC family toxin [Geminicoccaceae bacterium]HRY23886.1 type II toxin-antitoxin system VapC family toxin [Geminicoccaceae bacterium]
MKLLLDTQIAIWSISGSERLSGQMREMLAAGSNDIFVSSVSIWEIAIKFPLRKPSAPPFSASEAVRHCRTIGYTLLSITPEHAAAVGTLPHHHGDPFDRLLIAQALTEPLRLVTADRRLAAYSDTVIPC